MSKSIYVVCYEMYVLLLTYYKRYFIVVRDMHMYCIMHIPRGTSSGIYAKFKVG